MVSGVKRKNLTSDELMRRLENPSWEQKRVKMDREVTQEVEDDQGTQSNGSDSRDEESHLLESDDLSIPRPRNSEDSGDDHDGHISSGCVTHIRNCSLPHFSDQLGTVTKSELSRLKRPNLQQEVSEDVDTLVSNASQDFLSLGLSTALVSSLNSMSIRRPTPVQAACIPPLLAGNYLLNVHDDFY